MPNFLNTLQYVRNIGNRYLSFDMNKVKYINMIKGKFYRNPHAVVLYSWPTAEPSMRHAKRITHPPLSATLRERCKYLDTNADRYIYGTILYKI